MSTRIFVNPSGQKENLGDSVLRRAYLDALRDRGQLHVYAGTHSAYISGLGLVAEDIVYHSRSSWLRAALAAGPRDSRMGFALNAGEWVLDRRFLINSTWQTALLTRSRLGGGRPVALGIALRRDQGALARRWFRRMLALTGTTSWRDPDSRDDLGVGTLAPDWAFALGSAAERFLPADRRRTIAVTLRGDRPAPGPIWLGTVRALARSLDATVVVVNQMQEDEQRCAELARDLDGTVLDWDASVSHADHEERVRALYRDCAAVVSDRIHALILGMTEGAVPLGFTTGDPEKVRRTFAALTPLPVAFAEKDVADQADALRRAQALLGQREHLLADLATGRERLAELRASLAL
ncbi:hypothetical protein C5C18_04455 [Rathayibacter tritici]|uniref:hypothetical protein n=1 Tax=Rathayibacter tritici TaxID=33888 RepID=UPI000CE9163B|nr:hypothetical protein [Rathayibacter tritici]PPF69414.1 hypothetical protein C5C21_03320 [Rathayibacter tritici]PPG08215.1 hypothetical protein C5C18_04455 [Rathayibacter tritici]